ncbi:MAG: helix-turn-helix domain-containing protein [Myxococcota bacterium]
MPRRVDRQAIRSHLVLQSTELFAKEGYTALTMRKIAEHLGVSTGTLYHYFPNKEALFKGVVDDVSRRDMNSASASIPQGLAPKDRARVVLEYVEAMEPWFIQQHLVLVEYFRGRDPKTIRADKALLRAADFYRKAVAGMLGVDLVRARAVLIYLQGLLLQRLYDGGRTRFADQIPHLERLLADPEA